MEIRLDGGLPYVSVILFHDGRQMNLEKVLLDTGSASTLFSADNVMEIGLKLERNDTVHRIRGVGGAEFVFSKRVEKLSLGQLQVKEFEIEVGAMEYGFELEGIIGLDFLVGTGAIIDLEKMEIYNVA